MSEMAKTASLFILGLLLLINYSAIHVQARGRYFDDIVAVVMGGQ